MEAGGIGWKMGGRVFNAIFEANLKRLAGGTSQPMSDFRTVREFLNTPVLIACLEAPVSLVFLILIFAMSPVLGWSAVAAALVQTLIAWLNQRGTQPPLLAANRSAVAAQQYADGSLRSINHAPSPNNMELVVFWTSLDAA